MDVVGSCTVREARLGAREEHWNLPFTRLVMEASIWPRETRAGRYLDRAQRFCMY